MNREIQPTQVPAKDWPEGEDLWQCYGAERGIWTEAVLIALHQRRVGGNKWFSLIDKVASERTLGIALEKVAQNAGACGVDRVTIGHFEKDSQKRLLAVKEHLNKGDYQAQPIRRVEIPKAGSKETRPLGIPTVRGCKDALREVERLLNERHHHIVDVDIKGYFDNIPYEALMQLVKKRVADSKVLGLIEGFLKQGVL